MSSFKYIDKKIELGKESVYDSDYSRNELLLEIAYQLKRIADSIRVKK